MPTQAPSQRVLLSLGQPFAVAVAWLEARPNLLDALAALVVLGGGFLRFYRSTALSLWLDEGFTLRFARLPWPTVLGFNGSYDDHPPLYYAAVKAVSAFLPELVAGRYLSVFAGTATLAVLYCLAARLVGRLAALVACLVVAVSPLAIWYSQEARQYALTGLAVSIAYLALVSFFINPRSRWAALYALALGVSVYLDYSALYPLVPQLLIIPLVLYRHRRRAVSIVIAGAVAVAAYLPWLPQMLGNVSDLGTSRSAYLGATGKAVWGSIISITSLGGQGIYFFSPRPSPWELWSTLDPLMVTLAIMAVSLGSVALIRNRIGLLVGWSLLLGTIATAVIMSQVSPGFAARTVSYAVLGWAILLGAAIGTGRLPIPIRAIAFLTVVALIGVSVGSLWTMHQSDKEHWSGWAQSVRDAQRFGIPMVVFPTIAPTFLDAYEPGSADGTLELEDSPDLSALDAFAAGRPALWFASYDIAASAQIDQHLRELGMRRALRDDYGVLLSLNLYVRTGTAPGLPLDVNGAFAGPGDEAKGWVLAPGSASLQPGTTGRELTLLNAAGDETSAVNLLPGRAGRLYVLSFQARSRLTSGAMRAFLICVGQDQMLDVEPNGSGAGVPEGGGWQTVSLGVVCSPGTDQVRVDLRNAGVGELDLRGVSLYEDSPVP